MPNKYKIGDNINGAIFVEELESNTHHRKGIFKCPICKKFYPAFLTNVVSGKSFHCHECSHKINTYQPGDSIGDYGVIFIKRDETNPKKADFECPRCKKIFNAYIGNVQSNKTTSCGCYHSEKTTEIFMRDLSKARFKLLTAIEPTEKRDSKGSVIWKCKCDCGNIVYKSSDSLCSGSSSYSCGCVVLNSKGEERISSILDNAVIKYKHQKFFEDCRNPKTNALLKFDFYLIDYNICIEYDGQQHYKYKPNTSNWNNEENFKRTQYRDSIKTQYCLDNNIALIRIPYWDYDKLNEDYLLKLINEAKE